MINADTSDTATLEARVMEHAMRMVRGITYAQAWNSGKVQITLDPDGADALVALRVVEALLDDEDVLPGLRMLEELQDDENAVNLRMSGEDET